MGVADIWSRLSKREVCKCALVAMGGKCYPLNAPWMYMGRGLLPGGNGELAPLRSLSTSQATD